MLVWYGRRMVTESALLKELELEGEHLSDTMVSISGEEGRLIEHWRIGPYLIDTVRIVDTDGVSPMRLVVFEGSESGRSHPYAGWDPDTGARMSVIR